MWMQKHSACITSWMEMHTLRDALHYHETHDAEQMVLPLDGDAHTEYACRDGTSTPLPRYT